MSAPMLPSQVADVMHNPTVGEADRLWTAIINQAWKDIKAHADMLNDEDAPFNKRTEEIGLEALHWVLECSPGFGGFAYYAGMLRRQPKLLADETWDWVCKGCPGETPFDQESLPLVPAMGYTEDFPGEIGDPNFRGGN